MVIIFSDDMDVNKTKEFLNSTFIEIYDTPSNSINITCNLTWDFFNFENNKMLVNITFDDPILISQG